MQLTSLIRSFEVSLSLDIATWMDCTSQFHNRKVVAETAEKNSNYAKISAFSTSLGYFLFFFFLSFFSPQHKLRNNHSFWKWNNNKKAVFWECLEQQLTGFFWMLPEMNCSNTHIRWSRPFRRRLPFSCNTRTGITGNHRPKTGASYQRFTDPRQGVSTKGS